MEGAGLVPTVLTAMGMVAAVLVGVWGLVARYDGRVRDRMDAQGEETGKQIGQLRDRIDAQGKETAKQIGQLRDRMDAQGKATAEQLGLLRQRMAKLEGLLEGLREAVTGPRAA